MNRIGRVVLEKPDSNYRVYVAITKETGKKRLSAKVYTISPGNEMSSIYTVPKSKIIKSAECLKFLLEMEGDYNEDNLTKIREKILDLFAENVCQGITYDKCATEELHRFISEYIRENTEDEIHENVRAFIREEYGIIPQAQFKYFLQEYEDIGYTRKEVLETLYIMGALKADRSHSYDTLVSINNKKKRCYIFELINEEESVKEVSV